MRVEFEETSREREPGPGKPEHQRRPKAGLAAVLGLGVLSVGALLLLLRPDDGQTAAGTPRVAPTTSVTGSIEAVESVTTSTTATERTRRRLETMEDTVGASELAEIVQDGPFLLGIGVGDRDGAPVILRSADAQSWATYQSSIRDLVDVPEGDHVREFTSLVRTDSGLALVLLETTFVFAEAVGSVDARTRVIRLVSERGAYWFVDPEFPILEVEDRPFVFGHDDERFGFVDFGFGSNGPLEELLDSMVVDNARLSGACWVDQLGTDASPSLRVFLCEGGDEVVIEPADLEQPGLATQVFTCARSLVSLSGAAAHAVVVGRNTQPTTLTPPGPLAGPPVLLDDGTVAALVASPSPGADSTSCAGLVELPPSEPAVLQWDEGELIARFDVPPDIAATQNLFSIRSPLVAEDRGIRVALDDALWDISLVDGSWSRAFDLPTNDLGPVGVHLDSDNDLVLALTDGALSIWENGAPEWDSFEFDRTLREPSVMYSNDDLVIVRQDGEPVLIRLA